MLVWIGFFAIFLSVLVLDLAVLHRESRTMSVRQALGWTVVWICVAMAFGGLVYGLYEYHWFGWRPDPGAPGGTQAWLEYVTGYLLEWSLSVDNIFVIAVIFTYMKIPAQYQYRVLFWGIVGAIVLRGVMIAAGAALIHAFDWMFYVFGAVLLLSAARMLKSDEEFDPSTSVLVKISRRIYPLTDNLDGDRFFTTVNGARAATPLFVTLLLVDFADVVFAVDSIPAIFAVTKDPFIVFTSNAFAILGLRAMYFAIAGLMVMFRYIKYSLIFILAFVGVKMMLHHHLQIPHALSLGIIVAFLALGVLASLWVSRREQQGQSGG
ncbi:tellurite resistance protein TerC [Povalibacter uvarum]|uniref:Tellurite resistance protein TerC n=1 Tax=Povalibacter uvarum TaxID=732238 RepID=A0A841HXN5_9GAMM|nr:TerC family protein [Povalibacter uvarum]MBB6096555.1 tellurite resistance protein TerC [Povalibacter uvarum]